MEARKKEREMYETLTERRKMELAKKTSKLIYELEKKQGHLCSPDTYHHLVTALKEFSEFSAELYADNALEISINTQAMEEAK